jgi:2-polyprenyl-3-methyl-5-hydroxy-6-metoxy-1,4-benzoquinol methylase
MGILVTAMNEFDKKASDWDKNPVHHERARVIGNEIRKRIEGLTGLDAFEFGSGTGLLSFELAPFLKSITLADSSQGMIDILTGKIKEQNMPNMHPLLIDLEKSAAPDRQFDLLYTQMVLHHVTDLDVVFARFHQLLKPEGMIFIADLYAEDGSMHGAGFTGHNGFDPESLKKKLEAAGFRQISHHRCFVMKRSVDNQEKTFPIFLLEGIRG